MPFARLAGVAKDVVWIALPGQHLAGVEQDAVVLGRVAHGVGARFVVPVLEIQHARLERIAQRRRKGAPAGIAVEHTQDPDQVKVAAVLAVVDPLDGCQHDVVIHVRPAPDLELGDLGIEPQLVLSGVLQCFAAALAVGAVGLRGVGVIEHGNRDAPLVTDVVDIVLLGKRPQHDIVVALPLRGWLSSVDRRARLGDELSLEVDAIALILHLVAVMHASL